MKKLLLTLVVALVAGSTFAQVYSDVAPIFIHRCTSCHHENQHPVSLIKYSEVVAQAHVISTYLTTNYMPPWSPDTTYTRFVHEHLISTAEKNAIINWIASGTPAGDTTLAPAPPVYPQYQLYGTPDLELQIPTFTSNATTSDSYVCFSIPSGLTASRIVRAYEIVAGNASIVHHVIANVDTMGTTTSDLSGGCYTITGDYSLGGYAPGANATVFPSSGPLKMGISIKAGSKIVLQIHYPAGTAGHQDSTKIRMYFYPIGATGVRPVYVTTPLQNWTLAIPANTVKTYTQQYPSSGTLPYSLSIFAAFPHSHKLATTIVNYAYAATDTIPLIRINNWDFNWQGYYTFRHLTKVPTGYKLYSKHIYDNTAANPHNPSSPPVAVYAGVNTTDEMFFDSFQWLVYQPGDELYNIDSMLALDPVVSGIAEYSAPPSSGLKTYAYPNPFDNKVSIGYTMSESSKVTIEIYSIVGTKVRTIQSNYETAGTHETIWDGKDDTGGKIAGGSYIYILKTGNKQCYGKLLLMSGK
jgi:hypothetical protein